MTSVRAPQRADLPIRPTRPKTVATVAANVLRNISLLLDLPGRVRASGRRSRARAGAMLGGRLRGERGQDGSRETPRPCLPSASMPISRAPR